VSLFRRARHFAEPTRGTEELLGRVGDRRKTIADAAPRAEAKAGGVDRNGRQRGPKRYVMSHSGNDLVRRYLWMAALSAVRFNPAVRALYARVVRKHPGHKGVAVGHAMRKLLHLVFAIWKTGRPFNASHYPWDTPAHVDVSDMGVSQPEPAAEGENEQAASLRNPVEPVGKEVIAACPESLPHVSPDAPTEASSERQIPIDFAHLKRQLPIATVLDHLGLTPKLRGPGPQRRGACPIHRGDGRGKTFSVHLEQNVFQCFDASCAAKGDVIDLWANINGLSLRDAALDLVQTFRLEPCRQGPEKRNG
jgi:hypothetical protein